MGASSRSAVPLRGLRAGLIALALAAAVVPLPASWVESLYSRWVFLALQRRLTSWTNAIPIAVTDVLLAAALAWLAWLGVRLAREWRAKGFRTAAGRFAWRVATLGASAYLVFLATWGLNYRREPLRSRLDFARDRVTPVSVLDLARQVVRRVNVLCPVAHATGWPEWEGLPKMIGPSFAGVQRQLAGVEPAVPGVPKRSLLTFYLERAGVSGVTDPFALEVVVDRSQLPFERPFVAAHEWAHLAGYADESEANFIGWLVCLQGPPAAEYSGDLVLLIYLLNAASPAERAELVKEVASGPREDLRAIRRRAARVWPLLERPAWWLYDRYLRANRVEQGARSYGLALELMVGTKFGAGWVPLPRGK